MAWVKLDDHFFHNRKARAVGPEGQLLFLASMCWCSIQLNDGLFCASDVPTVAALAGVPPSIAGRLFDHGMWFRRDGDMIEVHDYLEWNRTRMQVVAAEQAARKAGKRSAERRTDRSTDRSTKRPTESESESDGFSLSSSSSDSRNGTAASTDDDEISTVPEATWDLYATAMLAKQPAGTVHNPGPWKRTTARNARTELGAQAEDWWDSYKEVSPHQLAGWLIDGRPHPSAQRKDPA